MLMNKIVVSFCILCSKHETWWVGGQARDLVGWGSSMILYGLGVRHETWWVGGQA